MRAVASPASRRIARGRAVCDYRDVTRLPLRGAVPLRPCEWRDDGERRVLGIHVSSVSVRIVHVGLSEEEIRRSRIDHQKFLERKEGVVCLIAGVAKRCKVWNRDLQDLEESS